MLLNLFHKNNRPPNARIFSYLKRGMYFPLCPTRVLLTGSHQLFNSRVPEGKLNKHCGRQLRFFFPFCVQKNRLGFIAFSGQDFL